MSKDTTTWTEERSQATIEGEKRTLSDAELAQIEQRRPPGDV